MLSLPSFLRAPDTRRGDTVNVAVAAAFATMSDFVIHLANTAQMTGGPGFQVVMGEGLQRAFTRMEDWTDPVPEPLLGLAVLALAAAFVVATLRDRRPHPSDVADAPRPDEAGDHARCHGGPRNRPHSANPEAHTIRPDQDVGT